jgi:hypothetical protein
MAIGSQNPHPNVAKSATLRMGHPRFILFQQSVGHPPDWGEQIRVARLWINGVASLRAGYFNESYPDVDLLLYSLQPPLVATACARYY